ncbi:DNA polymerase I, putative [Babesia caballi]|uniref:DNA polymerase I, putative n=1 Tax=Babesia caballi TaxID=5871 RepID=A0AAV4M0D1_BABCB|nr:DNA polymerase I, putative [Babesia caballi]
MALKIIRHVLVTLLLAEKDRQHIMSLVTDCVSDDSTFKGAMEVVVAVSHLYPLKDGAVRRISNLTLKGCGTRNRIEIMRLLGYCHFTKKGEEAVINILQNLCDPISTDEQKNAIVQCATSFVTNNDTEVLFSHVEWPEILATLANLQKNRGCTEFTNLTMAAYSKNSYSSAPHWIGMLWGYLLKQKTSENFMAAAWRSEAAMRFPDLVNIKSKPLEIDSAVDAKKVFAEFLGFSKHDVKVECLKGKTTFMYIHRLRVRGRSAMVHKITDSCQTDVKVEPYSDTGKRCNCVDCATDKMVMSSKSRRTIDNLYDNTLCSAYAVKHWSGYESAPFENLNENSAAEKFGGEAVFGYYRKLAGFRAEKYEVVNDVNCVKFPSHLGTTLTCCMKACSVPRKVTPFNIRSPTVTGFLERKERLCLTFKGKYMDDFTTPTKLHVTHPTPTVYPVPLKITQSDFGEVNTVRGRPKTIWIQSKRISR